MVVYMLQVPGAGDGHRADVGALQAVRVAARRGRARAPPGGCVSPRAPPRRRVAGGAGLHLARAHTPRLPHGRDLHQLTPAVRLASL